MASRTAPSGATAVATTGARARRQPDDIPEPGGALAVLETLRRDSLLEAVAMAAKELLRPSDLAVSLPKVIERIAQATGVDRAHIFLIDTASGQGDILQHFVWTAARPGDAAGIPERQGAAGECRTEGRGFRGSSAAKRSPAMCAISIRRNARFSNSAA